MDMDLSGPGPTAEAGGSGPPGDPGARQRLCLHDLFAATAGRVPERVAVVCGAAEIRYRDLDRRSDRLALFLRRRGVGAEVRVAVCIERSIDMVTAVLGVLKAGGAYVPLDPDLPPGRLSYILEDSRAALVLTQESLRHLVDGFPGDVIRLDRDPVLDGGETGGFPPSRVLPESLAYVVYTSGSTGRPKGVLSTHQGAVSYLRYILDTYDLGAADRVLQLASLGFDASVRDLLGPLAAGATVVLAEPGQAKDPWALLKLIEAQRITRILSIVPTLLRTLLETAEESAGAALRGVLRTVLVSGERLYLADCERARKVFGETLEVVNQYGPTECTMTSTYHRVRVPDAGRAEALIGLPIPHCRLHIFGEDGLEVPAGSEGQLGIAGPGLARGYLGQPGLTAEKFRPDPFGTIPGERLYTTGDLVRRLPDGNGEFIGRVDHQVKLRGVRIEPGEIERELLQLPGVRQAAVLLREDRPGEPRLVAYVAPGGPPARGDEMRELLEQRLPQPMIPSHFVFLDALPVNANGKLDRRALPAPEEPAEAAGAARPKVTGDRAKVFELLLRKKGLRKAPPEAIPRRQGDGPAVLSFQQERLWSFNRVEPEHPAYNMPLALRLAGRLDRPALERTLSELVRRHESLRTTFQVLDGRPVQVISRPAPFHLPKVDLRLLPESLREREAVRLGQEETRRRFDLSADTPLRGSLLVLAEDRHLLLLTAHHISSDGWSGGLLARELGTLYQAFSQSHPSPLPELEIQYPDFAEWQRRSPDSPALVADLEYWKGRLANVPHLELPADRPRPERPTLRGARLLTTVPAPLLEDLQALARSRQSTLFMLLLAALAALFHRHAGQDDIAVGTPVAGRKHPQTESLIGFFVDWLVLRADLSGEPTVDELLSRVRALALESFAHQEPPFQRMIEALGPERGLDQALFQVALNLQSATGSGFAPLHLPEIAMTPVELAEPAANLDLTLYVLERPGAVGLSWVYKADLFDPARIARWTGHFEDLLRAWTGDAQRRIADVPLLDAAEQAQLQVDGFQVVPAGIEGTEAPLVALRPTGSRPPFFTVHPAGGTAACYGALVAHLSTDQPFLALQARGLTTDQEPYRRVEDMALSYLQAVREVRPRGPYHLGGWSFGGLVAYEMARRLERAGEEVALLILLDTRTPGRREDRDVDDARTLALFGREAGLPLDEEELRRLGPGEMLDRVARLAEQAEILPPHSGLQSLRRFLGVYKASLGAAQEYLPAAGTLTGPIVLLNAGEQGPDVAEPDPADPSCGWHRYTSAPIRVHTVSGNHFTMLQEPYVKELAEVLHRVLTEAAPG